MASNKITTASSSTTTTTTSASASASRLHHPRRPSPAPVFITATSDTTSTSETEPLIGRDSPPPRYSSIEPSWEVPLNAQSPGNVSGTCTGRRETSQNPFPGWWTWVPGPAQMFPPGLEHLTNVRSLVIRKKGRKYRVFRDREVIYMVRLLRDPESKDLTMYHVQNNAKLDVLQLKVTMERSSLCSEKDLHIEVSFPPGNLIGVVQGTCGQYTGHDPSGDLLFFLHRESKICCKKPGYVVETREMVPIGAFERVRIPSCCCCCFRKRGMEITFPRDLDLRWKALLLGGAVVIKHRTL